MCHGASFYPLIVSCRLHIVYKKVRNLRMGVNKPVGKVSINSLCHIQSLIHHAKSVICVVIIIIDEHYS